MTWQRCGGLSKLLVLVRVLKESYSLHGSLMRWAVLLLSWVTPLKSETGLAAELGHNKQISLNPSSALALLTSNSLLQKYDHQRQRSCFGQRRHLQRSFEEQSGQQQCVRSGSFNTGTVPYIAQT